MDCRILIMRGVCEVYFFFNFWIFSVSTEIKECHGGTCLNGGTMLISDDLCSCQCQANFTGIRCEYEIMESVWPAGSYGILKSIDGCPETPVAFGWREGHINLTLASRNALYMMDQSGETWNDLFQVGLHKQSLIGPFSRTSFQLNFCIRVKGYPLSDTIGWPDGNYLVYKADGKSCPTGFQEDAVDMYFPNVSTWNIDGYLPELNITKDADHLGLVPCTMEDNKTTHYISPSGNATVSQHYPDEYMDFFFSSVGSRPYTFSRVLNNIDIARRGPMKKNGIVNGVTLL